jgi:hypothetical protein
VAIPLPNLDDRTFADLVEEARATIPGLAPGWTDHNPADPGMTLVELFAWMAEVMVYRTNRIPDANRRVFAKLLDGAAPPEGVPVDEALRRSVVRLREEERAVTAADYERLATGAFNVWLADMQRVERAGGPLDAWWQATRLEPLPENRPLAVVPVARARGVARRYLGAGSEAERTAPRAAHFSLVVVPERPEDARPDPGVALRRALWGFLEPRRVMTTRLHVGGPTWAPVQLRAHLARRPDADEAGVRTAAAEALRGFLHPLTGGPEGRGWPFGRDVHASELYALLEGVPGVDHVPSLELWSECGPGDHGCVAAAEVWHDDGTQVGLALAEHHLPLLRLDPAHLRVAAAPVPVRVTVEAALAEGADAAATRRAIRTAVARFFDPVPDRSEPPPPPEDRVLAEADLHAALSGLAGVHAAGLAVRFASPAGHLVRTEAGEVTGVKLEKREAAEVLLTLHLT